MNPATQAAITARRLSYAFDRNAFGNASREEVEAEIARFEAELDKWRAEQGRDE